MTDIVTFTNAASDFIKTMVQKDQGIGLRISIKKTGCSGYSYAPTIVKEEMNDDILLMLQNDVKVYVDKKWLHLLEGIVVDYVEDTKLGIKQKKLTFTNPNESTRCGCGESFHVS